LYTEEAGGFCRPLRNHSATWPFGSPYMGLIAHGNSILTHAVPFKSLPPSQPGGDAARCHEVRNPPYQAPLGQKRWVPLIRHQDDLDFVAP
jgi:hypothetical protein